MLKFYPPLRLNKFGSFDHFNRNESGKESRCCVEYFSKLRLKICTIFIRFLLDFELGID